MKKHLLPIFVGMISIAAIGGEIASLKAPTDFTVPSRVTLQNGTFSFKGNNTSLLSKEFITIDPAKKYKISGEFRAKDGTPAAGIIMGFAPVDKDGKAIRTSEYNVIADTATEIAVNAPAGSKTIILKNAAKWNAQVPHTVIAFNIADDFSDLPNRDTASIAPNGIKMNNGQWEITLASPLKKAVSAGTKVRQQRGGDTYINRIHRKMTDQWISASGIVSGFTKNTHSSLKFWPGTSKIRIAITFVRGTRESVTEFRNIKVEELD